MKARESFFNTPLESGTRSLMILASGQPIRCDLSRMIFYDYLLVHSGDIKGGPESLHPDSPFRSGELVARRKIVQRGLALVTKKGLVLRTYDTQGILYEASSLATTFLDYFETDYAQRALSIAKWIHQEFGSFTDSELQGYVSANIGRWGTEFANDPFLEDVSA